MTRDDVFALLRRRKEAIARREAEAMGELYADAATLESPLSGVSVGREAVVASTWAFLEAFPDSQIAENEPVIDGDRVSILAEVSGTHQGTFMGLDATGRAFRFPCVFLLRVADGYILSERRLYDFTGLLIQLGVLKAKPA
jgi:steroid delta-isomerase-like uncharacterized protein